MPRYFIDTFDHIAVIDQEGGDYLDEAAVRRQVHRTLAAIMLDTKLSEATAHLRADVRDAQGRHIMTGTLVMVIEDVRDGV